MEDMRLIPAVFAGSVISEGFGKISAGLACTRNHGK
jgi:hypothetical protein